MSKDDVQWAWIDIACIDQEDTAAQAEEVGKQASIFKNAFRGFVWLSHLKTEDLQSAVDIIETQGVPLRTHIENMRHDPLLHMPYDLVQQLHEKMNVLFSDPWFSSLWTLQEVTLRRDLLVLSAQAEPIWWERDKDYLFFTYLINQFQHMYRQLSELQLSLNKRENKRKDQEQSYQSRTIYFLHSSQKSQGNPYVIQEELALAKSKDQELNERVILMKAQVFKAGFHSLFSNNPNIQYGVARYRTTSRDVDRVYAIMQVYNLRVGKSLRPNENPNLPELIDEFALAINQSSPILGQMFVHTELPPTRKSWRITSNSIVPEILDHKTPYESISECTMTMDPLGHLVVAGQCCPSAEFFKMCQEARAATGYRGRQDVAGITGVECIFALDDHVLQRLAKNDSPDSTIVDLRSCNETGDLPISWFENLGEQNVWILRLGSVGDRGHMGLFIQRTEASTERGWSSRPYQRLGVWLWEFWANDPRGGPTKESFDSLPWSSKHVELH